MISIISFEAKPRISKYLRLKYLGDFYKAFVYHDLLSLLQNRITYFWVLLDTFVLVLA